MTATTAWVAATGTTIILAGAATGVTAGLIAFSPLDQAEAAMLATIAGPSQPQFSGELGVQSTADKFVAFAGSQNQHTVTLDVTCQYTAQAKPNICRAHVSPNGTVILIVTLTSELDAFGISPNVSGTQVIQGARAEGSLLLKGSFLVVNGMSFVGGANGPASIGVKQLFLLEAPVSSGS